MRASQVLTMGCLWSCRGRMRPGRRCLQRPATRASTPWMQPLPLSRQPRRRAGRSQNRRMSRQRSCRAQTASAPALTAPALRRCCLRALRHHSSTSRVVPRVSIREEPILAGGAVIARARPRERERQRRQVRQGPRAAGAARSGANGQHSGGEHARGRLPRALWQPQARARRA